MENTVIIDFFGLPGCGKSTRAHLLAQKLRENGKSVAEPSYTIDHEYSLAFRKIVKMVYMVRHYISYPNEARQIVELIKENGYNHVIMQYVNIAYKLIKCKTEKCDYIIFDEGFCQSAISLSVNSGINTNRCRTFFELLLHCQWYIPVFVNVNSDVAMARMKLRKEKDSRIEKLKDNHKRVALMEAYVQSVSELSYDCLTLNGESVESDISTILMKIKHNNYV